MGPRERVRVSERTPSGTFASGHASTPKVDSALPIVACRAKSCRGNQSTFYPKSCRWHQSPTTPKVTVEISQLPPQKLPLRSVNCLHKICRWNQPTVTPKIAVAICQRLSSRRVLSKKGFTATLSPWTCDMTACHCGAGVSLRRFHNETLKIYKITSRKSATHSDI